MDSVGEETPINNGTSQVVTPPNPGKRKLTATMDSIGEEKPVDNVGASQAVTSSNPRKRKLTANAKPPSGKRKTNTLSIISQTKNPVMVVNELLPQQSFEWNLVHQSGPSHAPIFVIELRMLQPFTTSSGQLCEACVIRGEGSSKQLAKANAATNLIEKVLQIEQSAGENGQDEMDDVDVARPSVGAPGSAHKATPNSSSKTPAGRPKIESAAMLLNEKVPGLAYDIEQSGDRFVCHVDVEGIAMAGEGASKKLAKRNTAAKILREMFDVEFETDDIREKSDLDKDSDEGRTSRGRRFADSVQSMINEAFDRLKTQVNAQFSKRKVLAGFVITQPRMSSTESESGGRGQDLMWRPNPQDEGEEMAVLCVSTGTKCLSGSYLNDNGTALNDCHAEVVARRSLKRHILREIINQQEPATTTQGTTNNARWSLVVPASDAPADSRKYRLNKGVQLHLYISSAPCGDSRIFSPHGGSGDSSTDLTALQEMSADDGQQQITAEEEQTAASSPDGTGDQHPLRRSRGLLRTKIESGEGTIPVKSASGIQTWDGIISGERLLTMSCSDKVCLWNCVGLQGALLSNLLVEPIFLSSLVLGSLFNRDHLRRAIYQRVAGASSQLAEINNGRYLITCPDLLPVNCQDRRTAGKSPNFSLNWLSDEPQVEIVNCAKGRPDPPAGTDLTPCSRLCKRALFGLFSRATGSQSPTVYHDAKWTGQGSKEYQSAKRAVLDYVRKAGMGAWTGKPIEGDQFKL